MCAATFSVLSVRSYSFVKTSPDVLKLPLYNKTAAGGICHHAGECCRLVFLAVCSMGVVVGVLSTFFLALITALWGEECLSRSKLFIPAGSALRAMRESGLRLASNFVCSSLYPNASFGLDGSEVGLRWVMQSHCQIYSKSFVNFIVSWNRLNEYMCSFTALSQWETELGVTLSKKGVYFSRVDLEALVRLLEVFQWIFFSPPCRILGTG